MSNTDSTDLDALPETTERFLVDHVRLRSKHAFSAVKDALETSLARLSEKAIAALRTGDVTTAREELERLASPSGLTILYALDHGGALILRGSSRKAIQYGIGNVLTATEMTQHMLGAALYAPIRVLVYQVEDGTVIEFDRPSTFFAVCGHREITEVAQRLDRQLRDVLWHAAGLTEILGTETVGLQHEVH
jgi:uncharacterized protein (DUF302 family)